MPKSAIGAGNRCHRVGLVDRAEQCPPHRHVIEGRMQVVEAQDTHRCRIMGNHGDIAVAGESLPPDRLAAAPTNRSLQHAARPFAEKESNDAGPWRWAVSATTNRQLRRLCRDWVVGWNGHKKSATTSRGTDRAATTR